MPTANAEQLRSMWSVVCDQLDATRAVEVDEVEADLVAWVRVTATHILGEGVRWALVDPDHEPPAYDPHNDPAELLASVYHNPSLNGLWSAMVEFMAMVNQTLA